MIQNTGPNNPPASSTNLVETAASQHIQPNEAEPLNLHGLNLPESPLIATELNGPTITPARVVESGTRRFHNTGLTITVEAKLAA